MNGESTDHRRKRGGESEKVLTEDRKTDPETERHTERWTDR